MHTHSSSTIPTQTNPALRAMFEARKRVFVDLLKWDVPVLADRYEVDQFDTLDAAYLILTEDGAQHRASARLLRTDRSHILADLFPHLCEVEVPCGEHIREITRFCIEPKLDRRERRAARNQLVTALVQYALDSGLSGYTAVANLAWFRQISAFGWKCRALGPHHGGRGETLVALHIEIDAQTPDDLKASGIFCPSTFQLAPAGEPQ